MNIEKFEKRRKELGLTQKEMGSFLELGREAIANYKNGTTPSIESLNGITNIFQVTADYLLDTHENEIEFFLKKLSLTQKEIYFFEKYLSVDIKDREPLEKIIIPFNSKKEKDNEELFPIFYKVTTKISISQAEFLKSLRKEKGLSQSQLASAMGMALRKLQAYEQGLNNINVSSCIEFARFFGVTVDEFIGAEITTEKLINSLPMSLTERKLFKNYLSLDVTEREKFIDIIELISGT